MIGPNGMNAFCSSSSGNDCFTRRSWGIMVAPKRPWMTRAMMSVVAVGARPHASEATVKPPMPTMNICRRPTMSPSLADVMRPTAKVSV